MGPLSSIQVKLEFRNVDCSVVVVERGIHLNPENVPGTGADSGSLKGGGCRINESCPQNVAFELESNLKLLHQK